MNHDVEDLDQQAMDSPSTKLLTQLRTFSTSISVNSLGTLFTSDPHTPTPTRPSSPHQPQRRFAAVKSIFTRTRQLPPTRIAVDQPFDGGGEETPRYELLSSPLGSDSTDDYASLYASGSFASSSNTDDTPPLTPESLVADIAALSPGPANANRALGYTDAYGFRDPAYAGMDMDIDDAYVPGARPHSLEIKEGKRPARPIDLDALREDIPDAGGALPAHSRAESVDGSDGALSVADDADEWYGLEYTLALSTRERRASEVGAPCGSAGEHSKSRESWAALHAGSVHPFFADQEYGQWKNWHRHLEREDARRRHRRGRAFRTRARELAWVYADAVHTRELIALQLEVYGDVEKGLHQRLAALEAYRPSPYYMLGKRGGSAGIPPRRSRSLATLRELRALPDPTLQTHEV
ncbi:hypothetical protein B0H15DRAFT_843371 [Mycena belliarum]|uniref:Uncharacterized protein n=1 Tax=Mycena belliarum TaxID=1033014 RepID=A0AAD6XLM0_9AGAR|nr:hypothetical protein B0H15DRAFT_843371 [Mycena belliae]